MCTKLSCKASQLAFLFFIGAFSFVCSCSGPESGVEVLQHRFDELESQVSVLSDSLSETRALVLSLQTRIESVETTLTHETGRDATTEPVTQVVLEPYFGTWGDSRGRTMEITPSTLMFSGDGLRIPYSDITYISDGRTFTLEVETRPGNFFSPYLVIFFDDDEMNEMQMHGYNSYDDAFMGNNRGLEWRWYRLTE